MAAEGWIFATKAEKRRGRTELRVNATCEDCGSYLENWTTYYRCPWTTRTRRFSASIDKVQTITCGWPYGSRKDNITAPLSLGRAR